MSIFSKLPSDIWYSIFSFLEKRDLKNVIQINKLFQILNNDLFLDVYKNAPRTCAKQPYTLCFFSDSMSKKKGNHLLELFNSNLVIARDNRIALIGRKENILLKEIIAHKQTIFALIQLDRNHICTASADKEIKIWSIPDLKLIDTLCHHEKTVSSLLMHGRSLLSGSWDNTIVEWDLINRKKIACIYKKHEDWVRALISLNSNLFASGSNDGRIIIWNRGKPEPFRILSRNGSIFSLAKLDTNRLISGSGNGCIDLWNWTQEPPLQTSIKIHHAAITHLLLIDAQHIIALSQDEAIFLLTIKENTLSVKEKLTKSAIKNLIMLDNGSPVSLTNSL